MNRLIAILLGIFACTGPLRATTQIELVAGQNKEHEFTLAGAETTTSVTIAGDRQGLVALVKKKALGKVTILVNALPGVRPGLRTAFINKAIGANHAFHILVPSVGRIAGAAPASVVAEVPTQVTIRGTGLGPRVKLRPEPGYTFGADRNLRGNPFEGFRVRRGSFTFWVKADRSRAGQRIEGRVYDRAVKGNVGEFLSNPFRLRVLADASIPATLDAPRLSAPVNGFTHFIRNLTGDGPELSWQAVAGATAYRVHYRRRQDARFAVRAVNGTSFVVPSVEANNAYQWFVVAIAQSDQGGATVSSDPSIQRAFDVRRN